MRLSTALFVCLVSATMAKAEDRYGPPPIRSVAAEAVANGFGAPLSDASRALSWSRKVAAVDVAAGTDILTLQPRVLDDGLLSRTSAAPMARNRPLNAITMPGAPPAGGQAVFAAPSPALAPNAGVAAVAPAAVPQPVARQAVQAPLPTSLFDDTPGPDATLASSAIAAAAAPVPVQRQALAGGQPIGAHGEVGSRYYSVHRPYGVDADPIPMSQTGVGE